MGTEREYLTAVSIDKGIITLIEPNGAIGRYRQRGITQLNGDIKAMFIRGGALSSMWASFKELPKNWSIEFEDEEIMGKARATFPVKKYLKQK